MSGDAIVLEGVTLDRRILQADRAELKTTLFSLLGGRFRQSERKRVLSDIDLRVPAGAKIGIIGPNGSGKSTLLKVVCGIFEPSSGTAAVRGRVAPLLELGAGFDPNLSVVDNIILYGVLLGFERADIVERIEGIIAFAELDEFRRYPVRALSSGMTARLGFAIATDVAPDVLIIDEVLSVGDERFRRKAARRIDDLWRAETTVLMVSHELDAIRKNCERAIWIKDGKIVADGTPDETIAAYTDSVDRTAEDLVQRLRALYAATPVPPAPPLELERAENAAREDR